MKRARGYRRQPELVLPNPRQVGAGKEGSQAEALPCPCRLHLYWHRDLSCLDRARPHVSEDGGTGVTWEGGCQAEVPDVTEVVRFLEGVAGWSWPALRDSS